MSLLALRLLVTVGALWLACLGLTALWAEKGSPLHVWVGRTFTTSGLLIGLIVVPWCFAITAWMAAIVGTLAVYLAFAGRRTLVRHRLGLGAGWPDWAAVAGVVGVGLACLGLTYDAWSRLGPVPFVPTMAALASLVLFVAGSEVWRLRAPAPSATEALVHHVGMMITALTVVITALLQLLLPVGALPDWMVWLGPTIAAVPSGSWWIHRVRTHGVAATFL